nr:hypothetical protein RVX_0630 [Nitratidesulfovibrio sp. HK-II]
MFRPRNSRAIRNACSCRGRLPAGGRPECVRAAPTGPSARAPWRRDCQ